MIVCLSPHPDDAVFSCGGLLAVERKCGRPTRVITVCAGSPPSPDALTPLARQMHRAWGERPDPMAHRREEDVRALAILGSTVVHWDYRDAIYRHPAYDSEERLFGAPAEETFLEEEVRARCAALPGDPLLFPLAVGGHVDHQLMFRVGWALHQAGRRVAFYEDLPYAAWENGAQARLAQVGRPFHPQTVDITAVWPDKVAAIGCYASQLAILSRPDESLLAAIARYATSLRPGGYAERLWWPEESAWN